jgi:hypothetical protein
MTNPQSYLEEVFGAQGAADLARLLRLLIPGIGELPDAIGANVPEYIAKALRMRKGKGKDDVQTYATFLSALLQKSQELYQSHFSKLNNDQATAVIKAWFEKDENFGLIREDCFTGYCAHNRWRDSRENIWLAIKYDPIFPCCERPDVEAREMLCEPRERLAEHLLRPEDRLPEALREDAGELAEHFCAGDNGYA